MSQDRHNQISERAYRLWEQEGQPPDRALDHWVEAEKQVNEGEGNRTAAKAYNKKTKAFAESGPVEKQARKAKADLAGPKGESLRKARRPGAAAAAAKIRPSNPQTPVECTADPGFGGSFSPLTAARADQPATKSWMAALVWRRCRSIQASTERQLAVSTESCIVRSQALVARSSQIRCAAHKLAAGMAMASCDTGRLSVAA
ncbi:MAG: DUF2934 domain-containing protein [Aliidongia sp.]